jgi:large subunit ribosomal protein L10
MRRAEKIEVVEELKKVFKDSGSVILIDFKNIDVPDITELRRKIRESGSEYRVVKNTLALRAAEGTSMDEVKEHFEGPTAVAYTEQNIVGLAKVLRDFIKEHSGMGFKVGVLEGQVVSHEQVSSLADMPSREELLSKVVFLMNAPLTRLAMALNSPLQKLAVLLKQLEEQKSKA